MSVYLVHQASTTLRYKLEVDHRNYPSIDGCNAANLKKQIDAALEVDEVTYKAWVSCGGKGEDDNLSSLEEYLLLQDVDQYEIVCRESVGAWRSLDFGDALTRLDRQYLAGWKWSVKVEKDALASFPFEV